MGNPLSLNRKVRFLSMPIPIRILKFLCQEVNKFPSILLLGGLPHKLLNVLQKLENPVKIWEKLGFKTG